MITELYLKNYRGFKDHCISFRELTVVVGANNAGKSTIVEALRLVSIVATRYRNLKYNSKANQKARAKIKEERFKTSSIVDIVAGKDLISRLSDWAQAEFGVSFSPMTLLRELRKDEIPDELKDVLEAIEFSSCFPTP